MSLIGAQTHAYARVVVPAAAGSSPVAHLFVLLVAMFVIPVQRTGSYAGSKSRGLAPDEKRGVEPNRGLVGRRDFRGGGPRGEVPGETARVTAPEDKVVLPPERNAAKAVRMTCATSSAGIRARAILSSAQNRTPPGSSRAGVSSPAGQDARSSKAQLAPRRVPSAARIRLYERGRVVKCGLGAVARARGRCGGGEQCSSSCRSTT